MGRSGASIDSQMSIRTSVGSSNRLRGWSWCQYLIAESLRETGSIHWETGLYHSLSLEEPQTRRWSCLYIVLGVDQEGRGRDGTRGDWYMDLRREGVLTMSDVWCLAKKAVRAGRIVYAVVFVVEVDSWSWSGRWKLRMEVDGYWCSWEGEIGLVGKLNTSSASNCEVQFNE